MENTIDSIIAKLQEIYAQNQETCNELFAEVEGLEADKESRHQAPAVKAQLKIHTQNKKDCVKAIELATAIRIRS